MEVMFRHALHTLPVSWCNHFLPGGRGGRPKTYCYEWSQAVTARSSIKVRWRKDGFGLVECAAVEKVRNVGLIFKYYSAGLHYDEIW